MAESQHGSQDGRDTDGGTYQAHSSARDYGTHGADEGVQQAVVALGEVRLGTHRRLAGATNAIRSVTGAFHVATHVYQPFLALISARVLGTGAFYCW